MHTAARWISIVAHPFLLLPLAIIHTLSNERYADLPRAQIIVAMLVFILCIAAYSFWRVHRRHWQHVDASASHERRDLLRFALPLLALLTFIAYVSTSWSLWTRSNIIVLIVLVIARLLRRYWHVSLHVCFAMMAMAITTQFSGENILLTCGFALIIALLSWSRFYLGRHRVSEIIFGIVLGGGAGLWMIHQS